MMKRDWKTGMKGCALLLSGVLLLMTGCTSKNALLSVEEEIPESKTEQVASSSEEEGLYNNWIKKKDTEEEQELETEQNEIPADVTETQAMNNVLAEVMRMSGEEDPEFDQTSVKIVDQNEDAYLVSIDFYDAEGEDYDGTGQPASGGTELYRVDKRSGEVQYLTEAGDFR